MSAGALFSTVCLFPSPSLLLGKVILFFFVLMLSIAKEGLQRFLPSLKESDGANTEATMNMYYCKY